MRIRDTPGGYAASPRSNSGWNSDSMRLTVKTTQFSVWNACRGKAKYIFI